MIDKIIELFLAKGRFTRSEFWLTWFMIYVFLVVALNLADLFFTESVAEPVSIISFLIAIYVMTSASIKRLHDLNRSGWDLLFMFVPIYNIYLYSLILARAGTVEMNEYDKEYIEMMKQKNKKRKESD